MTTDLKDVSAIQPRDLEEISPAVSKKRSKEELRSLMKRMTDPHKVLDSPNVIGSRDLLKLSYEMGDYPYPEKISMEEYESEKQLLQIGLLKVQAWVKQNGERILGLFEGRDAARQGWSDKAFYGTPEPACGTCGCTGKTNGTGAGRVVLSALYTSFTDEGRNGFL